VQSGVATGLLGTGFNHKKIGSAAAPKSCDNFLMPQFKSHLAVNRGVPYSLTGMVLLRGEEQGDSVPTVSMIQQALAKLPNGLPSLSI